MTEQYPKLLAIFTAHNAGGQMESRNEAWARAGRGLEGDRYCTGHGSWNKDQVGHRQVTFINATFFPDGHNNLFSWAETRRNLVVQGVELMWLIGREFEIGDAKFRGVKYCDPCERPSRLIGTSRSFHDTFQDRGGLVAEITGDGIIVVGNNVIIPKKRY